MTALMSAAEKGHLELVKWLHQTAHSDVNASAKVSVQRGHYCWEKGMNKRRQKPSFICLETRLAVTRNDAADFSSGRPNCLSCEFFVFGAQDGSTALILASERGHLQMVKWLCDTGADINATKLVRWNLQSKLGCSRKRWRRVINISTGFLSFV